MRDIHSQLLPSTRTEGDTVTKDETVARKKALARIDQLAADYFEKREGRPALRPDRMCVCGHKESKHLDGVCQMDGFANGVDYWYCDCEQFEELE
jgi:hypothetical protein